MNILFLFKRIPFPPNRGDKLRRFHFARTLSQEHTLSLISFIEHPDEITAEKELKAFFTSIKTIFLSQKKQALNMALSLFGKIPITVKRYSSRAMQKLVDQTIQAKSFDIIITDPNMAPYIITKTSAYIICDFCDAFSSFLKRYLEHAPFYRKPIVAREYKAMLHYEQTLSQKCNENWIISSEDEEAFGGNDFTADCVLIPNGIDTSYFSPLKQPQKQKNILFVGYMGDESIDAIQYFCRDIFPRIKKTLPDVHFTIVGAHPPKSILELAKDSNVTITGFVEDLRPYYNRANISVAPMRFVMGMQNKILESMAMEVPVVTTSGGNEGINAKDSDTIFVEDTPAEFAKRCIELLTNSEKQIIVGKKARNFVLEKFNWNSVQKRINELA